MYKPQKSKEFGAVIKRLLEDRNLSQRQFAKQAGLEADYVSKLVNGEIAEPRQATMEKLAKGFELTLEELRKQIQRSQDLSVNERDTESPHVQTSISNVDALIQDIRTAIHPYIEERCGKMRVLDMEQPIGLGDIYTSVNILERITGRTWREIAELQPELLQENFDRWCIGQVREKRVPGQEAVEQHRKLMILGKPGAGKTTFLKHLAMQCIGGQFQTDRVPFFITLKDFAESPGQPNLMDYLINAIPPVGAKHSDNDLSYSTTIDRPNASPLHMILETGRALILLDGLDEVRETDASRVLRQIEQFTRQFPQNQFLITCRIAAREYTFEQFTEVEIADFDDTQIADFVQKWFHSKNDPVKAEQFIQKLQEEEPIRELATSPLLLTLLCLVYGDTGDFPSNRAELYATGVNVLLKHWDVKRNIIRDQVYRQLSPKRKEDLLSQIAFQSFEAGTYFFKQREVTQQITRYIQNLPGASTDEEALQLDSSAVLKSIEAQHGLLVERARGIYSFSHLTFQEYFTAREIVNRSAYPQLVTHLTEKRWREVFLLTAGMMPDAGELVQLIKQAADKLLADDNLQQFLTWVEQKSRSVAAPYKSAAIRAFYFDRSLDRDLDLALDLDLTRALDRDLALALNLDDLALALDCDLALDLALALDLDLARDLALDLDLALALDLARALDLAQDVELQHKLQTIRNQLPDASWENYDNLKLWWQSHGQAWTEQLRAVMIEHRNIGHDWRFSQDQQQRLRQYYDTNLLLVACLNSDCYISRDVRQHIENTLLLPMAEN